MGLKKEVRELLNTVKDDLTLRYGHERVLDILTKENRRLRDENRRLILYNNKLMDRFMAKDFESYATYKEEEDVVYSIDSKNEPDLDDSLIGEVIE